MANSLRSQWLFADSEEEVATVQAQFDALRTEYVGKVFLADGADVIVADILDQTPQALTVAGNDGQTYYLHSGGEVYLITDPTTRLERIGIQGFWRGKK